MTHRFNPLFVSAVLLASPARSAELAVRYGVTPVAADGSGVASLVRVRINLPGDVTMSSVTVIMPRAIPMGYGRQPYDQFVTINAARSRSGTAATIRREDGPRWSVASAAPSDPVAAIEYEVDIAAMERAILAGGDSSRAREGYLSLLGYSVFAYVEGFEGRRVDLSVTPPPSLGDWPVFSTLAPKAPAQRGPQAAQAADFYALADSQIVMGSGFRVRRLLSAPELFMLVHAEGAVDEDTMAPLAVQAFEALVSYFGTTPFPHFTLFFDYLKPLSPRHTYGFSMEHLQSATFGALATAALSPASTDRERTSWRYNVAHHIAHAWIPKRCAGEGYFPFRWELAPLIDTIWFSEGFGQYAAADALSDVLPASAAGKPYRAGLVEGRFRAALREMPDFLKQMPLVDLSRTASTVYSEDFRTGRTVFSRGGLMAYEMDERMRATSGGLRRLRDALRFLMAWSAKEKRPFRIDELPTLFKDATGVDTRDLMQHWLAPMAGPELR